MKLIILIFVASIIAFIMGVSTMAKINTNHNEKMFTELHNEHCVLLDKLNKIDEKCDGIARIEQLIRQNMSAPYTNDR
jgi:GTP1/Obg family GTP-binding protein